MRESNRRRASASAVYHPCFRAFLFPFGAPGDGPPVHPAASVRHRRRLATPPFAGLRSTARAGLHELIHTLCAASRPIRGWGGNAMTEPTTRAPWWLAIDLPGIIVPAILIIAALFWIGAV